jgi:hypothetical protein
MIQVSIDKLRDDMRRVNCCLKRLRFVSILKPQACFCDLRYSIPPASTGWTQLPAAYGAKLEQSQEKTARDLFRIMIESVAIMPAMKEAF